jgi:hypothetical protein
MALESSTYINGLVVSNPTSSDNISDGDNHIRLIKSTIKATFPNVTGAVSGSHTAINSAVSAANAATNANTASTIVKRDGSGNFTAGTITAALSGNASTASTLQTARTIGGVSFNGGANINLPGVNTSGNQNTSGNAATATQLATARTIGGVSFNGTANINLPGVNTAGNQSTSGNAATASRWATARSITLTGDVSGTTTIRGDANVSISATVADDSHNHIIANVDGLQSALNAKVDDGQVLTNVPAGAVFTDTTYSVGDGGLTTKNFTTALKNKLDGIEAQANVTDTANVVGSLTAGSNISIASNGTISSTDTNTTYSAGTGLSLSGTTFTNSAPDRTVTLTGGGATSVSGTYPSFTISSTNTTYSVGNGGLTEINFTSALNSKLAGIESGAKGDQTATEIRSLLTTVDGSGSGIDADKIDGKHIAVVSALPGSPDSNTIYFVT